MATTVTTAFDALLADLVLTPNQKAIAEGRFSHLETYFARNIPLDGGPWKIGSYDRGTLIRWRRDLDVLVALAVDPYWARYEHDSAAMLTWMRNRLNDEYGSTQISIRQVAVRMFLGEGFQVDLVPAFYRKGGGFLMPDGRGSWKATNPPYHARIMTDANIALGTRLKPLVRVMKAWNDANAHHLQSFHLEMMVWEMWHNDKVLPVLPQAVADTLRNGDIWMKHPMSDPWLDAGIKPLDAYLSDAERGVITRMFESDQKSAEAAIAYVNAGQTANAFERWAIVFNHKFPAYG
jgi:hypothetical protein